MDKIIARGMTKKEYAKWWYWENRDKSLEYRREWGKQNRATRANYDRQNLLKTYGLTLEQYEKMVKNQFGQCFICHEIPVDKRDGWAGLHIDHDERYGRKEGLRFLLCSRCNTALGLFKENIRSMERAIGYLKFFNGRFERLHKVKE